MASSHKDSKGWRICFVNPNGDKKQIRPGKGTNKATANQISRHIGELVACAASQGTLSRATALWLGDIGDKLHAKLANAGLVEQRKPDVPAVKVKLTDFVVEFIADGKTSHGKPAAKNTICKWKTLQAYLKRFFRNRAIDDITPKDAQDFRKYLEAHRFAKTKANPKGRPLSENGKRKLIATAKVIFNAAVRVDLISKNPFEHEVSSTTANRSRDFYITSAMAVQLLDACPDVQWRLMFSLWRLAGLRKMEIFHLSWSDVLWDQGKLRVHIPKTQHHEGKAIRYVPIGDILPYLEAAFAEAEPGTDCVITRYNKTNLNLHKPFLQIVDNAGLVPWPKLFQNLRASCETQWLDSGLPAHVVANWMGHSVQVQNDSYAQVDDHHFDRFNEAASEKVATQVATKAREMEKTPAKLVATKVATEQQKTVRPMKKHGPKTVLSALERSRTSTPITGT